MTDNKHVYLKNEPSSNDGFKKTRNVQTNGIDDEEEEIELSKLPNPAQQDRLRRANAILYSERKQRRDQRTIEVPATIELIIVRFIKVFNESLKKEFYNRYGLLISSFEDFNKSVLFEIEDSKLFETFIKHLEFYYESPRSETYQGKEYNLIALIVDVRFLSGRRRFKSYFAGTSSLSLIATQTEPSKLIYNSLIDYLKRKKNQYTKLN